MCHGTVNNHIRTYHVSKIPVRREAEELGGATGRPSTLKLFVGEAFTILGNGVHENHILHAVSGIMIVEPTWAELEQDLTVGHDETEEITIRIVVDDTIATGCARHPDDVRNGRRVEPNGSVSVEISDGVHNLGPNVAMKIDFFTCLHFANIGEEGGITEDVHRRLAVQQDPCLRDGAPASIAVPRSGSNLPELGEEEFLALRKVVEGTSEGAVGCLLGRLKFSDGGEGCFSSSTTSAATSTGSSTGSRSVTSASPASRYCGGSGTCGARILFGVRWFIRRCLLYVACLGCDVGRLFLAPFRFQERARWAYVS